MKKLILTLIVLGAIGGGTYAYYKKKNTVEPTVSTLAVSRGDIADTVQATGTLQAVKTVNVGTQVSGVVQALYTDFNQIVKKGQVIARLDPSLIETAIEQRKASVTRAEADIERLKVGLADARRKLEQAKGLWEKQLIPRDQLDTAELNVKTMETQLKSSDASLVQAKADLNTQQVNLNHTVITAPIDGIVIQRSIDEGATVQSSMTAPTLYILAEDLTKMQIMANIDESEVGRMRQGQAVTFTVDAYPTERFQGTVSQVRLQPTTVQNVVTYSTVIEVPNPTYKLMPGMTANVTIEVARRENVLRVPAAALRFRPTADMFTALKQEVPADLNRGMGGRGGPGGRGRGAGNGGNGNAQATAPQQTAAAQPGQTAGRPNEQGGGDRGGDRPAGEGRRAGEGGGGGRGNFANMSPEEREKRMQERLRNASPEERERMLARMREGGGRGGFNRGGNGARQQAPAVSTGDATTIDALFAPLQMAEGRGRVWIYENKQMRGVNVRTGITDGTWTEVLEGGDEPTLQAGTELVTNVVTGMEQAQRPGQQGPGGNPLMGNQGGRGGPGGGPGGGRGR